MTTINRTKSKKTLFELIKTTFIGGFLVIIPAYLAILIFNAIIKRLIALILAFFKPIASLPGLRGSEIPTIIALIIFVLICFIAGLVAQSNYARIFRNALEPLFEKIPGYLLIRKVTNHMIKIEEGEKYDIAFVALGDSTEALSPGFLIEKHENGSYTVFVPAVPTPTVGSLYIVPKNRIFPVDVPLMHMVKFISRWGEASPELLAAIKQIKLTTSKPELLSPSSEITET